MTDEECEADDLRRQASRFRPIERASFDPGHLAMWMSCVGREDLLGRTLDSLNWYTWPGKRSYAKDGYVQQGQAQTFFTLLSRAAGTPGFTRLTMIEDDLRTAKHVLDYIAKTRFDDDIALHSWFHQQAPYPPQPRPTWMIGPAREFSCNQAITMPASTVYALLDSPQLKGWSEPHGADMLIGQVMPDALVAYHFPNLVDHVTGPSLVGSAGTHRSCTFVGEDFDALDLTRAPSP